jgi:hypothetical protein
MFGSISLALGAVSTVSSLIEAAAAGISNATTNTPAANPATFNAAATTTAPVHSYSAQKVPGVMIPKFDHHTQATLLAYQEMHRGA